MSIDRNPRGFPVNVCKPTLFSGDRPASDGAASSSASRLSARRTSIPENRDLPVSMNRRVALPLTDLITSGLAYNQRLGTGIAAAER